MHEAKNQSGYANLIPLQILATIVFVMTLFAIPKFTGYVMLSKLTPVLDTLERGVAAHYKKHKALPDAAQMVVIANNDSVGLSDDRLHIDLALLDEDLQYSTLQLQPIVAGGGITWDCTFSDDLYRDELPVLRKGICQGATQPLMERSLWDRGVDLLQTFWKLIVGYVIFIIFTFIVG